MVDSKEKIPDCYRDPKFQFYTTYRSSTKNYFRDFTGKELIQKNVKTLAELMAIFQKDIFKNDEPLEAVVDSAILSSNLLIQDIKTTPLNPLPICRKFIKDQRSTNVNRGFFTMRKIELETEIMLPRRLQVCLEDIKDTAYQLQPFCCPFIQSFYRKCVKQNELDIQPIVSQFLSAAWNEDELISFEICGFYPIRAHEDEHTVNPAHVIIQSTNQKVILICEDKKDDMNHAILQLFDQMITYSLTQTGRNTKYICGLATSLYRWQFCCFINTRFTNNRIISNEIALEVQNQIPTTNFITSIAQTIRGFLTKDVGQIIMQVKLLFY